jgi:hypothetical protein
MRLLYAATSSYLTATPPTQSTQPPDVSSGIVPNDSSRTPPRILSPSRDALFALSAALDEADQLLFTTFSGPDQTTQGGDKSTITRQYIARLQAGGRVVSEAL